MLCNLYRIHTGSSTTNTTTTSATSSNTTTTSSSGTGTAANQQAYNQLMQQMITGMAGQGGLNSPPEERFRTQLETLASMGFVDRQANIQALMATYGDVNAAIDRLLNSRPTGEQS